MPTAILLISVILSCTTSVPGPPISSPSTMTDYATSTPAVTLPPPAPIDKKLLIGRWRYIKSMAVNSGENVSQFLYGSAIEYGGTLNFDVNGMFGKYIGLQIFSGPFTLSERFVLLQSSRYYEVQTIIYNDQNNELILLRQTEDFGKVYEYFEKIDSNPLPYEEDYH